jgi:hypothetical protein
MELADCQDLQAQVVADEPDIASIVDIPGDIVVVARLHLRRHFRVLMFFMDPCPAIMDI